MKKKIKNVVFLFVAVLLFLFLIEVTLRFTGDLYLRKLYTHRHPDAKPKPSKINILCLGESSTAGFGLQPRYSYPAQLHSLLRRQYPSRDISVFVPPHVGQNTSQMVNRMEEYIQLFKPRLFIVMVGSNNEGSFAESHICRFLDSDKVIFLKFKASIWLSKFRLFKLTKYLFLKYIRQEHSEYIHGLEAMDYALGGPELVCEDENLKLVNFTDTMREALIKLWRYDVQEIISKAKGNNIDVILMTYHINPCPYLSIEDFVSMAKQTQMPLLRNDLVFQRLIENNTIGDYLLSDNWHPNEKGYALIASNVLEYLINNRVLERYN